MARHGENIYKRKDGRWEGRYKSEIKADGTTRYSSIYGKTYAEVKGALSEKSVNTAVRLFGKSHYLSSLYLIWLIIEQVIH